MNTVEDEYLRAIQKIPGGTPGEKFKWLGRLNLDQQKACGDLDQLPRELASLVRVDRAVRRKIREDITWALKSDDQDLVNRAFQATWFFDGSHKDEIDAAYFREHLFPYVSLQTRIRIVKTLALMLTGKDPTFAYEMFTAVKAIYGLKQSLPLIVACDEDFVYQTIVENRIELSCKYAKTIFHLNPDLLVRYLRLSKPYKDNEDAKSRFKINIKKYEAFLPLLIKKRLEAFAELYEMHKENRPHVLLSNKNTEVFLKNGMKYLMREPLLYIDILSLKKISPTVIDNMFPNMLPTDVTKYKVKDLLPYLLHYPEDKKLDLLCRTYKDKYGIEFFNEDQNVTLDIMPLLSVEERIKQVKRKTSQDKIMEITKNPMDYKTAWHCYLPTEKSIPIIKNGIHTATDQHDRVGFLWQMLYTCKINKDDDALCNVLEYFQERHKNEQYYVFEQIMKVLLDIYDAVHLGEKIWFNLNNIIKLSYVKHSNVPEKMLEAMAHYRLLHGMSIEEPVEILLELKNQKLGVYFYEFNSFNKYPMYERCWIENCVNVFHKKYKLSNWQENKKKFVYQLIKFMYNFNDRNEKSSTVKHITIKDYPWLMDTVKQIMWDLTDKFYYYDYLKDILYKHEREFHDSLFPSSAENSIDFTSGAAFNMLKRDPQCILNNWEKYLTTCKQFYHCKNVQRFLRVMRWYEDIPIKFVQICLGDIRNDKMNMSDKASSLAILAILLHGETLTRVMDSFIPHEKTLTEQKSEYEFIHKLPFSMRLSNPPVPLDLVARMCQGDYLSIALMSMTNLCRRIVLPKVMLFAQKLAGQNVSVRKHGIRMICMVASIHELADFMLPAWENENHHSIRGVLLLKANEIFREEPCAATWSMISTFITTMTLKDDMWLSDLTGNLKIPYDYVGKYVQLIFEMLDSLETKGLSSLVINTHIVNVLNYIILSQCDDKLPEELNEKILRKYLFHTNDKILSKAVEFMVELYLKSEEKYVSRIIVFTDVFTEKVKSGWDQPHPQNHHFYPVNSVVHRLVRDFVKSNSNSYKKIRPQIISNMLAIFSSVLTPHMDANSYLLLVYRKELENNYTPMKYGLQLGQKMPELVELFSPLSISFIADVLNFCLTSCFKFHGFEKEHATLDVIKGLIEADNVESYFIAANIFTHMNTCSIPEYDQLFQKLRKVDHPGVKTILCDAINKKTCDFVSNSLKKRETEDYPDYSSD